MKRTALLLAWWLGLWQPADRAALERIWRALVRDDPAFRVLFVGVRPYTWRLVRSARRAQVVTIDRDGAMRFFGARRHHTVALEEIGRAGEAAFDLAVVNGVLGSGIDTTEAADAALAALHAALRPGGVLVLGINEERPATPELGRIAALGRFERIAPPPFGAHRHVVPSPFDGTHTFLFFQRP